MSVVDLKLTEGQYKALRAIQILFDKTDYQGNRPRDFLQYDIPDWFNGPILEITLKEYLDAYATGKSKTKRGKMEYHRQEREDAIKNLEKLQIPVKVYYSKQNRDGTLDLTIDTLPLLIIIYRYPGITPAEEELIRAKHLRATGDHSTLAEARKTNKPLIIKWYNNDVAKEVSLWIKHHS